MKLNKYIKQQPTPKQAALLAFTGREALYGGGAGGGKSSALLMAALQHADTPKFKALILRRTLIDLTQPGGLLDRSAEWLSDTDARWDGHSKTWHFPSGAQIKFGYMEAARDQYNYQGGEYHLICFDELTHFLETQYTYLFSRLRRTSDVQVPMRILSASNPGAKWIVDRFRPDSKDPVIRKGLLEKHGRIFIPALYTDNPHIDHVSYKSALSALSERDQRQLAYGEWVLNETGGIFNNVQVADSPVIVRQVTAYAFGRSHSDESAVVECGIDTSGTVYVVSCRVEHYHPSDRPESYLSTFADQRLDLDALAIAFGRGNLRLVRGKTDNLLGTLSECTPKDDPPVLHAIAVAYADLYHRTRQYSTRPKEQCQCGDLDCRVCKRRRLYYPGDLFS